MECPNCKLLTFLGEWLTPKETQGMATRPCEECNENIDTAFLVQPREKKRGMYTQNVFTNFRIDRIFINVQVFLNLYI